MFVCGRHEDVKSWKLILALVFVAIAMAGIVSAEERTAVEAPPPPDVLRSGQALEPQVTIREAESETVYEYRVNGQLVMVKVQPKGRNVPPYYFFDQNGDGELDYSQRHPRDAPSVNQWVLFRWW